MAGQVNVSRVRLGDNPDTTKNFIIKVPAVADGTLTIERESGPVVLSVDAAGNVYIAKLNPQAWLDVKASRNMDVDYTNNTLYPIDVAVAGNGNTVGALFGGYVNGVLIAYGSAAAAVTGIISVYFRVPPGATYRISPVSFTSTIATWKELRS